MINDCPEEMNEFLEKHLTHRLTLLRTLRERNKKQHDYNGQGDLYRCVKDSNLIAVRLFMDFLGLKGVFIKNNYELASNKKNHPDDRKIDKFIGRLLIPSDISEISHRITLAGVYVRADANTSIWPIRKTIPYNRHITLSSRANII